MSPNESIASIKGVGPALAEKFAKLNIHSVEDLIENVPRRYDDYSKVTTVSKIMPGPVTIKVEIHSVKSRYSKKGLHMTEATAVDESGAVKLVWFNQPYRGASIKPDEEYFVSGEFANNYKYFAITNPACELVSSFPVNTARLVPIYKLTKGLGPAQVRKVVKSALLSYRPPETLPGWLVEQEGLISYEKSLYEMHFPTSIENLETAKKRIGFEEVFELTLASELNREEHRKEHSLQIPFNQDVIKQFVSQLPFKLTNDQRKVAWEIFTDMQEGSPMNRLVEGDVGSGKTVVALLAIIGAVSSGFQAAFMAPTELLANQHAKTIFSLLESVGMSESVVLLTGSMNKSQKEQAYESISSGQAKIIIGTHAIFQDKVVFKNLGLIIVDEQHRFGVQQRKTLQGKAKKLVSYETLQSLAPSRINAAVLLSERKVPSGTLNEEKGALDNSGDGKVANVLYEIGYMPHVMNMTATPIPRSLALTLYGEMDVSIISELPPGRIPIVTKLEIPENRIRLYDNISVQIDKGRQVFVVCPQIAEGETAGRLSVIAMHKELSTKLLKGYKVGLLHGKMKAAEKDLVMQDFINKKLDVLVSTTVIEVGVDVPNATVMVIEGADKFGLAQLHQLRGRVGRGQNESYCYLILSDNDAPTRRLKLLESENNGFKLAEYDLDLRGPGAIYGTMQHGELDLRVAKLTDIELIKSARACAKQFIEKGEDLLKYSKVNAKVSKLRSITNLN